MPYYVWLRCDIDINKVRFRVLKACLTIPILLTVINTNTTEKSETLFDGVLCVCVCVCVCG